MSMTFSEMLESQKIFDKNSSMSGRSFYSKIGEDNIHELEHLLVCMVGELGEFSNILKKVVRGDFPLSEVKGDLDEELVDVFIYLMKIANQFDVDLEEGYLQKLEKNKIRFGRR